MVDYRIYDPDITTVTVVDPYNNPAGLTYVSNSSLAYYGGQYWAVMDGSTQGTVEGSSGQQIWMTTSVDGQDWGPPFQPFRNATYCSNPIAGSTLEWQPNLVVVGTEMWCTWSGADGYISKLTSPTGTWTNYRFEFSGEDVFISSTITGTATAGRSTRPTIDGINDWLPFFSQNPVVLSSGVVACPLTLESVGTLSTQTTAASTFTRFRKYNTLFKTSNGTDWSMTRIDTSAFGDFSAWEPFVVENRAGHVYVYSRNLDARAADKDFMLVAVSTDGATTFSNSVSTNMLVPSTRGFALQTSPKRWVMTHADQPQNSDRTPNQALSLKGRRNGAVFVSRRGVDDFVPGVNFSGDEMSMNYPQCITTHDGLVINYTAGVGGTIRRSMKTATLDLPSDDFAYVHPRSMAIYNPATLTDPTDSGSHYSFIGVNRVISANSLSATTGVTYSAWVRWTYDGDIIMDSRQGSGTEFGQVFFLRGLAINVLNFPFPQTVAPYVDSFVAAVIDNTANTVTTYVAAAGTTMASATGHYRSILFAGQPADGDTVTINGVTYTFRNTATAASDVAIGVNRETTIVNLGAKIAANSMLPFVPGSSRLVMTRSDVGSFTVTSGSSQITVESSIPLSGGPVNFGMKPATVSTSLRPFAGRMYEGRVYNSALSAANILHLYNSRAAEFGYSTITGTSTAPGSPLLLLDPTIADATNFPTLGSNQPARCEVVDSDTVRIYGEGSAALELPYSTTRVSIRYKLGAAPTGGEKYVIATLGTSNAPLRIYVAAGGLYANGRIIRSADSPTAYSTLTMTISTDHINIGEFEQYFAGKPRLFLGDAYPQNFLAASKTIDYDISAMSATMPFRNR